MSSAAQINANRENAQHSTGPTTEARKDTTRKNSLKHGLASWQILIPGESEDEFNELLAGLIDHHQPANITETMLVQDMAKHHWIGDRALRMQNYAIALENNFAPPNLGLLIRYHTANERAFHKAHTTLIALQKTRLAEIGSAPKSAPPPPAPEPVEIPWTHPSCEKIVEMYDQGLCYNPATQEFVPRESA